MFDRANVLDRYPGRHAGQKGHAFPRAEARQAATEAWPWVSEYERVLFVGRAVWDSFAVVDDDKEAARRWRSVRAFTWTGEWPSVAWMPHTSGIVTWWNEPKNRSRAEKFLRALAREAERIPA
jgi:hypothetical protein